MSAQLPRTSSPPAENELTCLEAIHLFVEVLDKYFSNVCELDLVWHFNKASAAPL